MTKLLSPMITGMSGSATVQVMNKARALKRQGIDIMDLGGGDPDFDTPEHIQRAAIKAMQAGFTHYVPSTGIPELRQAIARKLREENGVEVDPDKGIIVTSGGKLALYATIMAIVGEGDEVILPEPAWVSYRPIIQLAGGTTVPLNLTAENGFTLSAETLEALITPKTKMIAINSPSNPTGKVLSMREMEIIADAARGHDLYVISDEIYEKIIFDGHKHISPASLPGMAERTVTLNGASKAFAMTGWRLGYLAGPAEIVKEVGKIQEQTATCAPSFVQSGMLAALEGPEGPVEAMTAEYKRRRDFFVDMLNDIPRVSCFKPEGAFYAFPNLSHYLDRSIRGRTPATTVELCSVLLDEANVAIVPGEAFDAPGYARLSFALGDDDLGEGCRRMADLLAEAR